MSNSQKEPSNEWPRPRIEIEKMSPYSAPLEGRRKLLRLDFNENTIGPSPKVIEALKDIPNNHIAIYPEYDGIKEAFINNIKSINPLIDFNISQIGIFNGVDAAIHAIFHAFCNKGDQLLTTNPTFGYYTPCAHMQGMKIISIPYKKTNFNYPINEIREVLAKEKPKIFIICNPNNPTGTRLNPQTIIDLSSISPTTLFVIDELYEAFTGDSILPIANFLLNKNIVVLRSLSKTAGLAGLRIGFAIGNSQIIDFINRVTGPYDVNSYAITAGFAALNDQNYINQYVENIQRAKEWIGYQLATSKVKHHIDGGNYLLIWPKKPISYIEKSLRSNGILVRSMDTKALLKGSFRVSIGTIDQMKEFWNIFSNLDDI